MILPVLAAGTQLFSSMVSSERDVEDASRLLPDTAVGWELALAALLVVAWGLSVAGSLVAFAGFTVTRDGDRLRIRRGLLQRSDARPVRRIHGVRVVEGLLRRPFGLAALRVEVAGYAEERSPRARCTRCCGAATSSRSSPSCCPSSPTTRRPHPAARRAARRYVLPRRSSG